MSPHEQISHRKDISIAFSLIWRLAIIIFVTEVAIMLAMSGVHISAEEWRDAFIDATALTVIVSPITYWFLIKPFILRAVAAKAKLVQANEQSQAQARELAAALADLSLQKTILDNHCLVTRTDPAGRITYANDAFCKLSGYELSEVIGGNHRLVNSGYHDKAFWQDMFATMINKGIWQGQVRNRAKDGSIYWVQATNVAERDGSGRLVGFFSVRSDITETKLREQELAAAQLALQSAIQKAEAASEAKSRFLSTMSHEMRTPLNGVVGAMELLKLEALAERQKELVQLALQSSDALLVHINDVLDFSKLEAGKLELTPIPFNIRYLVKSVSEIVSHRVHRQGNRITCLVDDNLPEKFVGDPVRLRQILLNFASNAAKFTHNGTITITIKSAVPAGNTFGLEFAVTDTGPGIAPDRLNDLFKEFSMLDGSFARKSEGTGLGLAISKSLVEAMGGTIGVDSVVGQGSTFWFKVQLDRTDDPVQVASNDNATALEKRKLAILLVDDNPTNRLVGSRLLQSIDHDVDLAVSGAEAIAKANAKAYDVILMDVSMPEMDGIEATKIIRAQSPHNSVTPIIALTAHAVIGDRDRFMKAGMSEYLSKPLRLSVLQERLAAVFAAPVNRSTAPAPSQTAATVSDDLIDQQELAALEEQTSAETVRDVIAEYLGEAPAHLAALLKAIADEDPQKTQKAAHALSGSSASVGAVKLSGKAKYIEEACINGRFADAVAASGDLSLLLDLTSEALLKRSLPSLDALERRLKQAQ